MRLFLAVELDERVRRSVAAAIGRAQGAAGDAASALRWTPAENVHLTLHFIGAFDASRLPSLFDAIGAPLPVAPFDVALGRLGVFPPRGPLRTLWMGIDAGLEALVRMHEELGRRLAGAGVPTEARPFTPHLTLARARDRDRHRSTSAKATVDRLSGIGRSLTGVNVLEGAPARWRVTHATLMSSDLSGPRPRYESIKIISCQ